MEGGRVTISGTADIAVGSSVSITVGSDGWITDDKVGIKVVGSIEGIEVDGEEDGA